MEYIIYHHQADNRIDTAYLIQAEFRGFPLFFKFVLFTLHSCLYTPQNGHGISYLASEDAFFYVLAAKYSYRSITLKGGEERPLELPTHVQITNISFGEDLADATGRTVVKLTYSLPLTSDDEDDEDEDKDEDATPRITTVLCALTPGKVIQLFCCRMRIHVSHSTLLD
jgi:hypothetical protein